MVSRTKGLAEPRKSHKLAKMLDRSRFYLGMWRAWGRVLSKGPCWMCLVLMGLEQLWSQIYAEERWRSWAFCSALQRAAWHHFPPGFFVCRTVALQSLGWTVEPSSKLAPGLSYETTFCEMTDKASEFWFRSTSCKTSTCQRQRAHCFRFLMKLAVTNIAPWWTMGCFLISLASKFALPQESYVWKSVSLHNQVAGPGLY